MSDKKIRIPSEVEYKYEDEEGLLLHLSFDEENDGYIRDVSGNGHNGKIIGNVGFTEGCVYKAVELSGGFIEVDDFPSLNFSEDKSFTAEIMYKWYGKKKSGWPCIFQKGLDYSSNSFNYFGLWLDGSDKVNLGLTGSEDKKISNYQSFVRTDNKWHCAVIIQDAEKKTVSLIIDGVCQKTSYARNCFSQGKNLFIGGNGTDGEFFGALDELKIYNYPKDPEKYKLSGNSVDKMEFAEFNYTDKESGMSVALPYRIYFPSGYKENATEKYPLMFFLHGYGECGCDNIQQIRVLGGENKLLSMLVSSDKCIVVAPQCKSDAIYNWVPINKQWSVGSRKLTEKPTVSLAAATALLHKIISSEKIDSRRIYCGGISMGGYGAWEFITRNHEIFAAAIPLCGSGIPDKASLLTDISIWAFHGENDATVPPSGTRDMVSAIINAGGKKAKATYLPGVGHDCWNAAYSTEGLLDWLFSQSK